MFNRNQTRKLSMARSTATRRSLSFRTTRRLALLGCLVGGPQAWSQGVAPRLVKTTTPVCIQPDSGTPSVELRSVDAGGSETAGATRTNRFFELNSVSGSAPSADTATNHAGTMQPAKAPQVIAPPPGRIQKNPLIAGAPPKLRRFTIDQTPKVFANNTADEIPERLAMRETEVTEQHTAEQHTAEQHTAEQHTAEQDRWLELISKKAESGPKPCESDRVRSHAATAPYGPLAIDQIGAPLTSSSVAERNSGAGRPQPAAESNRFPNDKVLIGDETARDESDQRAPYGASDIPNELIDAPVSMIAETGLIDQQSVDAASASVDALPSVDIDALLASDVIEVDLSASEDAAKKPSLGQRWSNWSRKFGFGRHTVTTQPVSARRPSANSKTSPHEQAASSEDAATAEKVNAIDQWFGRKLR